VSQAHQCVHEGQLSRVIELESRDAFTAGKHGGSRQVMELTSVNKAFQDVLLDIEIIVANGREPVSELGKGFDGLFDPISGYVIGSRLGAQAQVIPDVLLKDPCALGRSRSSMVV
jgi:hypothetical protein